MPETTITIYRGQREGLYELVRNHLGGIEDFWVALERTKDFAVANAGRATGRGVAMSRPAFASPKDRMLRKMR